LLFTSAAIEVPLLHTTIARNQTLFGDCPYLQSMANTLLWVLVGIIIYTLAVMSLRARGVLPDSVHVSGPIITLHTKYGRKFLDRLSRPRRFWRAWSNIGVGISLVVMVGFGAVIFASAILLGLRPEQAAQSPIKNPQNALVIPGVNEFLPLSAAPEIVTGLALGLIVHEGGHGLLCRVEDIDIESMGLALFAFIPIGAFVEPDEDNRAKASRGAQTRMFAAGVTNNFALTGLVFLLLFGPVAGSIAVAPGVAVGDTFPGGAAAEAGIGHGDRITAVNGTGVDNATDLERELAGLGGTVNVTLGSGEHVTVDRYPVITRVVEDQYSNISFNGDTLPRIESVNGTAVTSERAFREAITDRDVATIETDRGTQTVPVGAFVARAQSGEALAGAGAPENTSMVVTSIDGQRVVNASALGPVLDDYDPGDEVTVVAYVDGERETYTVELGERDGEAYLGVEPRAGYSGMVVDDFGIDAYPAEQFLTFLSGGSGGLDGIFAAISAILFMPFLAAFSPELSYNFAGFVGEIANFYTVTGPLGFLGSGVVFLLANVLFWTGWINFNLGVFNCVPAFPLDGGHILRTSTEAVVSRLPVSDRQSLASTITMGITVTMLVALLATILGPALLS
jgi:membrane-associated protease RseP (regulator of RpoE activity)